MFDLIKCDTFWAAVSAIATAIGATAIVFAARQFQFTVWLKAQEVWVSNDFIVARSKIFARLDNLSAPWSPEDKALGLNVCRRVDEFVRLAPYLRLVPGLGKRRMLSVWGDPLAKAWLVLEPLVKEEREATNWSTKWDAFARLGRKALSDRPYLQPKQEQTSKPLTLSQEEKTMAESSVNDPLGVLEAARIPLRSQVHFDVGDGWEIIMSGEEVRRPKSLQRVAITRAEIIFDSEENLKKFLEIIKESDARLSTVPDPEVMYDWQMVRRKGLIVRFGVAWYDRDFFQCRKDAHSSSLHEGIFKQFGVSSQNLRIEHIPL